MSSSWSLRRRHDEESFRRNSVLWTAGSYAFDDWLRPRLLVGHFSIDTDFVHPQLACDKSALWFISIGKSSLVDIKIFCKCCFFFFAGPCRPVSFRKSNHFLSSHTCTGKTYSLLLHVYMFHVLHDPLWNIGHSLLESSWKFKLFFFS